MQNLALQSGFIQMITGTLRDNEIKIMKSSSNHSIQQNPRCAAQRTRKRMNSFLPKCEVTEKHGTKELFGRHSGKK